MENYHSRSSSPSSDDSLFQASRRSSKRRFSDEFLSQKSTSSDVHDGREDGRQYPNSRHTKWQRRRYRLNAEDTLNFSGANTLHGSTDASKDSSPSHEATLKVTLPSFRESFGFALSPVSDRTEEKVQRITLGTLRPARFDLIVPSPRPQRPSTLPIDTTESPRFTFKAVPSSDPWMYDSQARPAPTYPGYPSYRFSSNIAPFGTHSISSGSSSDGESDFTLPTSSTTSEYSYDVTPSPVRRPIKLAPSEPHRILEDTVYHIPTVECSSISSIPLTSDRTLFPDSTNFDRAPVAENAGVANTPNLNVGLDPSCAQKPLPPTSYASLPSIPSHITAQSAPVSNAFPQTRGARIRTRPNAPPQEWEVHATEIQGDPRRHYRCLWNVEGFECEYNAKKQAMKRHIELTHLRHRPHQCDWCEKAYGQRTSLDVHMATHTGKRDHVCPDNDCPKAYSDASRLLRHRVSAHGYVVRKTAPKLRYGKKPYPHPETRSNLPGGAITDPTKLRGRGRLLV